MIFIISLTRSVLVSKSLIEQLLRYLGKYLPQIYFGTCSNMNHKIYQIRRLNVMLEFSDQLAFKIPNMHFAISTRATLNFFPFIPNSWTFVANILSSQEQNVLESIARGMITWAYMQHVPEQRADGELGMLQQLITQCRSQLCRSKLQPRPSWADARKELREEGSEEMGAIWQVWRQPLTGAWQSNQCVI